MKPKKATTYVFVAVFFVSMAFIARHVTAQKTEKVEWLGWVQIAKPSSSPDPRIHMKKTGLDHRVGHVVSMTAPGKQ
jgi:hypothetical protein